MRGKEEVETESDEEVRAGDEDGRLGWELRGNEELKRDFEQSG